MTATISVTPAEGPNTVEVAPDATRSTADADRKIPLTIPSAQEYYWHYEWQKGEREAVSEIRSGGLMHFDGDDPEDVARWLDEPDGEE